MQGTTLSGLECKPICGDGKVYSTESCDDGNNDNNIQFCGIGNDFGVVGGKINHGFNALWCQAH